MTCRGYGQVFVSVLIRFDILLYTSLSTPCPFQADDYRHVFAWKF